MILNSNLAGRQFTTQDFPRVSVTSHASLSPRQRSCSGLQIDHSIVNLTRALIRLCVVTSDQIARRTLSQPFEAMDRML